MKVAALGLLLALAGCALYEAYTQPTSLEALVPAADEIIVARGDTVSGLSRRYGVPQQEIIRRNALTAPYHLRAGQRLRLPLAALVPPLPRNKPGATVAAARPPAVRYQWQAAPDPLPATGAPQPLLTPARPHQRPAVPAAAVPAPRPPEPEQAKEGAAAPAFIWPVRGPVLANFRSGPPEAPNEGVNIAAPRGTAVQAAAPGIVVYAGNEIKGFGNLLLIRHAGGWISAYAHLDRLLVARDAVVQQGEAIGTVGSTGAARTPQLHFELRQGRVPVDPLRHLPAR